MQPNKQNEQDACAAQALAASQTVDQQARTTVLVLKRPELLSGQVLAFVGDSVFHVAVRTRLVCRQDASVNSLHFMSTKRVCAGAQANYAQAILPLLSEPEQAVYRRGLSAKTGAMPKNCTLAQYHAATAFEAVLGYLHLLGDFARIEVLIDYALRECPTVDKPIVKPYKR